MGNFIQFWQYDLSGNLSPMCGSDGRFYPDGRWSRSTTFCRANDHARKLNANMGKGIVAYSFASSGYHAGSEGKPILFA